jgi:ribosomal-protein-alanine N-acetyltransferase
VIRTARLILREWRDADLVPFANMNADPRVMEYFESTLTREESEAAVARYRAHHEAHGFAMLACELAENHEFIGVIGLQIPRYEAHFTPCVEVGWRLAERHWAKGYATEGARAMLDFGFGALALEEVVAITVADNVRSRHVMEKLGMHYAAGEDFDHPLVPASSSRRKHILYRIRREGDGITASLRRSSSR